MMKPRLLTIGALSLFLLTSCERSVQFDLESSTPKLVVEATIENGQAPVVILSRSMGFFSTIDPSLLQDFFVRDAEVYISNGVLTHRLREFQVPAGGGTSLYYYSNDPASPGTAFSGELNRAYSLRILWQGKEFTAETSIPDTAKQVEALFWKPAPAGNPPEKVVLMVRAFDPPGFGNYFRYFTKRNGEPFYPGLISVYDDQVIDGSVYEVQVERGIERTGSVPDYYSFFDRGDTVTLKLCDIDKATYDFWRTMEFTYASVGNPFSSPTRVLSNINGGALGYFGGYAARYRTLIIPQ